MKQIFMLLLFVSLLTGCDRAQTGSPEADQALKAFNQIVKENPYRKGYHNELKHWGLSLPAHDKFEWIKDTSANKIDFAMVMEAEPFIKAGLEVDKLKGGPYVFQDAGLEKGQPTPQVLIYPFNVSDKRETAQGSEDAMRRILKQNPALVKYQPEQKNYRLKFSGGFETLWTEELGLNPADMIFVIEADPLIAAGLDISKLGHSGWAFQTAGTNGDNPNQLIKTYRLK